MNPEISAAQPGRGELWILAAALAGFGLIAVTLAIPAQEDAFIYYRYAWNWAHGNGLVFNTGDPVEGFSGPIWMAVLALLARAGFDLPSTAPALGILCGAATLVATWLLGREVGLSRFGRLASVAVLALSVPFVVWSRSGLETPFYSLAIVVACGAYLGTEYPLRPGSRHPWLRWVATLAPVAVTLGRPEGLLLVGLLVADRLTDGRDFRGALRYALPTVIGYGGFLIWRFLTFHRLVPNTSVKLYPLLIDRSGGQLLGYVLYLGALPLALPVLALLRSREQRRERRRLAFLLAVAGLLSVAFNFLSGGDYRPGFRFFIPTLPVLLVAVWYGYELLAAGRAKGRAVLLALLLVGPLLALRENPPRIRGWRQEVYERWRDPYWDVSHGGIQTALWIEAHVPRNSVVAFGQMGRVPYYLTRRGHEITFVDTLGLVDRQVAEVYRFDRKLKDLLRDLRVGSSLPQALEKGRRERANLLAETVLARHPDFILIERALDDYGMMKALVANPRFKAAYRQSAQLPPTGAPYLRIYSRLAATMVK